jgi:hypothetical protein
MMPSCEAHEMRYVVTVYHIGNVHPTYEIQGSEFLGEPMQSTWIDPVAESRKPEGTPPVVHEGPTVEEMKREGLVGLYIPLKDLNNAVEKRYFEHKARMSRARY